MKTKHLLTLLLLGLSFAACVKPGTGWRSEGVVPGIKSVDEATVQPTTAPTSQPSSQPTSRPTSQPSSLPSGDGE